MAKKRAMQQKRWTLTCSDEISRPRKSSYLSIAVEHLGPFKHKTQAEALAHGVYIEDNGQRLGISRELALEFAEDVARRFNTEEHLARTAPRLKHVMERLTETQRLADALAAHLDSLDDITRHELQNAGTSVEHLGQFRTLMEAADAKSLPVVSGQNDSAASWFYRLKSLSAYVEATCGNLVHRRKRDTRSPVDRGGNTNLWKDTAGNPRWGLVNDAIVIYEVFKPGKASGTVGGPLHKFILDLFEYATGREGNIHAKAEEWLKKLVKAHRQDNEARAEAAELDAQWEKIVDLDPNCKKKGSRERILEINAAGERLQRAREAHRRIMWPHLRHNQAVIK